MRYTQKEEACASGLDEAAVARSRREHGANIITEKKQKSFFAQFVSNLNDPVIKILLGALIINLLLSFKDADWIETVGIGVAVLLAALISTLSEYRSARAFERLSAENRGGVCRVRRKGGIRELAVTELVVGDRVLLSAGEQIPADGRLLSGALSSDQSAMTGEGREVKKRPDGAYRHEPSSVSALFRGCSVTAGQGEMEVLEVGDRTLLGKISHEIQEEHRESPLKLRLSKLARQISLVGYGAAILVMLAYLFNVIILDSGLEREVILFKLSDVRYLLTQFLRAFTLGLTVLVVAVPEGLPMMIAVVLSSNMRRMVRDRVLVRRPMGLEAAGSMNLLFTDKTGTLTEGRMHLSELLTSEGARDAREVFRGGGARALHLMLAFRYCNDATVGEDGKGKRRALGGNATSRALLDAVLSYPVPRGVSVLSRLPFDSERKYAAVTLGGRERLTLVVGAPEKIFPYVTKQMQVEGETASFARGEAENEIKRKTVTGARVLAVAISADGVDAGRFASGITGNLIYLGAAVLSDPLRKSAAGSVSKLHGAGIGVVMITGDGRETAESIARGCGIMGGERQRLVTGEELSRMSDREVKAILPSLAVVARALPSDKSRLVRLSQEMGLVVGMTGDGINDSPALRASDVGFSMGSGTQVAKDAGDVIILDDDLASVVRAVLYGRGIYDR
ncbi:MAG: cation-transporting P-type ATPase, partial [Ruminococcaceae bacterium]|nr:cation-transporting P-type ATPase [Oscillospiraceae bacterium]